MGLINIDATIPAGGGNTTLTYNLNPGILTALSINGVTPNIQKGQTIAQVTLQRGGTDEAWAGVTLINDYVYHNFRPSFFGLIYLEPNDVLRFYLESNTLHRVWLAGLTTAWQQVTLGGELIDIRPRVIEIPR